VYWIAYCPRVNGFQIGDIVAGGKSTGAEEPIALSMNSFQIVAGNVGPETAIPCTLSIGISPPGKPIQTVASRFGVKPQNHASA
jgi:hypothetical protein